MKKSVAIPPKSPPKRPTKPKAPDPYLPGRIVKESIACSEGYFSISFKELRESVEKFSADNGASADDVLLEVDLTVSSGGYGYGDDPLGYNEITMSCSSLPRPNPDYDVELAKYEKRYGDYREKMKEFRKKKRLYDALQAKVAIEDLERQKKDLEDRLQRLKASDSSLDDDILDRPDN